jgi:aldehyde dehydrogenase (NAD+)
LGSGTIAVGGQTDPAERYIAPTVLTDVSVDSPIMQDEVFGPVLPVLEIDSVEKVIDWVNSHPRPLELYIFAEDDEVSERILEATESGDACVNDCSIQPLIPELPFGGVGTPGWANTTAGSALRRSPTPAACSTTARSSTPPSNTPRTPSTSGCMGSSAS